MKKIINSCQICGCKTNLLFCPGCLKEKNKEVFYCPKCRIGNMCINHYVDENKKGFVDDYYKEKYSC